MTATDVAARGLGKGHFSMSARSAVHGCGACIYIHIPYCPCLLHCMLCMPALPALWLLYLLARPLPATSLAVTRAHAASHAA